MLGALLRRAFHKHTLLLHLGQWQMGTFTVQFEPLTLETTMREVESKYAEAEKKLDTKKKKQVTKIIKENHDDPDAITEKLASLTGFDIYVK